MFEDEVVEAATLNLSVRCERQRRLILVMAGVLCEMGFDLLDLAKCAEPATQKPQPTELF